MALGLGGLDKQLDDRVSAYSGLPQEELSKKVKLSSGLLDALAAEKVLQQKAAAARELSLSQESSPKTIVQRNEEEVLRNTQQELANQVDGTLKNKQAKRTKNMNKMAGMDPRMLQAMQQRKGIAGAPVQQKQVAAQGGIVGYAPGGPVTEEEAEKLRKSTRSPLQVILDDLKKKAEKTGTAVKDFFTTDDTDGGTTTANRPESLTIPDQQSINQGKMGTYPIGAGIGPETLNEDFIAQLEQINKSKPKGIPAAMPNMPNQNMIDPASVPKPPQDLSPDDTPETVQAKKESYDEWLQGLIAVLTAPASGRGLGGGNVGRAYLAHSQRVLNNKNKLFELEIKQQTADAADEFNRIELDSKTYNQLSQRLLGVQKQIDAITSEVMSGQLGQQLFMLEEEVNNIENFKDGAPNPVKVRELEILEGTIAQAIRDRAQSYQYDNMGLFAQRKLYQDQLARMDDKRQFNLNKSPKLVP